MTLMKTEKRKNGKTEKRKNGKAEKGKTGTSKPLTRLGSD